MSARLTLIAALAKNRVIGANGAMPWHLPEDLRHFKQATSGHPVIMGRKTFDSILASLGRPLPGRRNIVISRSPDAARSGCEMVDSLPAAIALAGEQPAFVIGGAEIYAQALPLADALLLTEIEAEFDGDAWFPEFDRGEWQETFRENAVSANGMAFSFVSYRRRPN